MKKFKYLSLMTICVFVLFLIGMSACNKSNSIVNGNSTSSNIKSFDTSLISVVTLIGKSEAEVKSYFGTQDYSYITTNGNRIKAYVIKNTYSAFNIPGASYYVEINLNDNRYVDQIAVALDESQYTNSKVINTFKAIDSTLQVNSYTNKGLTMWQKVYSNKDSSTYKVETKYSDSTLYSITDSSTLQFETNYTSTNAIQAQLTHTTPVQLLLLINKE